MRPFQGLEQAVEQVQGKGLGFAGVLAVTGMGRPVGRGQQHAEDAVGKFGGKRVLISWFTHASYSSCSAPHRGDCQPVVADR